jgi:hypothetical protein
MHKKILALALILTLALNTCAFRVSGGLTVAEKEGYVTMETARVIYFVNQDLINLYGLETFSRLFNLVDERFAEIMNITGWSSERFYGHKLEVTVDKSDDVGGSGSGGFGKSNLLLGTDFISTNQTSNAVDGFPSWSIGTFLHEMTHGITPSSIVDRKWLAEGYACFLTFEVQVMFGDRTRSEVETWYDKSWEAYVNNGYLDFRHNKTIQDDGGYFITAWMLNNISKTYGFATHERFFASLPDEYLYYMPSFPSLSIAESTSYNYYLDSLIVGYYSQAAGTSLYGSFKSWGVKFLPNPTTTISINGTSGESHAYTSEVTVSLSAAGDNEIHKIEYSVDQKAWNNYSNPFSVSDDAFIYFRSTDNTGRTGTTASITLTFESSNPLQSEPFPTALVFIASVGIAVAAIGLLGYFKKRYKLKNT